MTGESQHIPFIIHRKFGLIHTELNDLFAFHFMQSTVHFLSISSLKEITIILFTSAESETIESKSKNKSSLDTIPSDGTLAKRIFTIRALKRNSIQFFLQIGRLAILQSTGFFINTKRNCTSFFPSVIPASKVNIGGQHRSLSLVRTMQSFFKISFYIRYYKFKKAASINTTVSASFYLGAYHSYPSILYTDKDTTILLFIHFQYLFSFITG